MKNLIAYAKNSRDKLAERPLCATDALILSWLSYFTYPESLKSGKGVALKDMKDMALPYKETFAKAFNPKSSKKLLTALERSERFKDAELSDFCEESDEKTEKQFAALCVKISDGAYFLSFRGTDASFVAWKEDFNLARTYPLPSQTDSAKFAEKIMLKYPKARFYFGGHSKGGTAAFYAAMKAREDLQERIERVYNFDGPGFFTDVCSERGYMNIAAKTVKIVPKSSLVGMIFESGDDFLIVKSRFPGIFQHNPFFWHVKGNCFKYENRRTRGSVRLEKALNDWIAELSLEERGRFIKLIYDALYSLDTRDFNVFFRTLHRQIPALYREYKKLDGDDKIFFAATLKRFVSKYISGEKKA